MIGLTKVFDKDEQLTIKILKCLDYSCQTKVIIILKSKDLTTMTIITFFGKLREHELEMNRLNEQERMIRR